MIKSDTERLWKNLGKACEGTTLANDELYFMESEPEFLTIEGLEFKANLYEALRYCAKARIALRSIREKMDQKT